MRPINQGKFRRQVTFLRRQFLQEGDLPFRNVLSEKIVLEALNAMRVVWNDSIYTPLVTLWVFLRQVLSADQSCRAAVARLVAHRVSQGQRACSSETSAYCQARKRLPENFFAEVARGVGRALDKQATQDWLWKGRGVYMFDGTIVSLPDTEENVKAYPKSYNKGGQGFPIARIGALISLSCGAILNLGFCRYAGKGQGEVSLLRRIWDILLPGDVILGDSLMSNWAGIVLLKERGLDLVSRLNKAHRRADFRKGKRLGSGDHIVRWKKPTSIRSVDRETYLTLPEELTIREARIRIQQTGFRTRTLIVVTTLLDPNEVSKEELAELYRARWNNELDLRSIKSTMQMDFMRCKTPDLVHKEVWAHVIAYNLIRTIIAQAAENQHVKPRTISFKGTMQTLNAFQPVIALQESCDSRVLMNLFDQLLDAISRHRIADRPDRFEPRLQKRRQKNYGFLRKPRATLKRELAKRVT